MVPAHSGDWTGEAERRAWFLFESSRDGGAKARRVPVSPFGQGSFWRSRRFVAGTGMTCRAVG
jgi:hypothetical protein